MDFCIITLGTVDTGQAPGGNKHHDIVTVQQARRQPRRADLEEDVAGDDDVGERRIVGMSAGAESEGGVLVAPGPAGAAVADSGEDVNADDRAAVGLSVMPPAFERWSSTRPCSTTRSRHVGAEDAVAGGVHAPCRPRAREVTDLGAGGAVNHDIGRSTRCWTIRPGP